jgi:putative ABC transport system permease protein
MFRNYCIVAWRNLVRNKTFSLINITGLAIGLAITFLIYQYVHVELSYDRFHKKIDRIYRIPISYDGSFASLGSSAVNHPAVGPAMKADFPEVEDYARMVRASLFIPAATVSYREEGQAPIIFNEERVYLADRAFLTIFSFDLIAGNASNALEEPRSIVITQRVAEKYFGKENALGKILSITNLDFKVTGVMQDVPENSHLKFDMLVSFSTLGPNLDNAWTWPEFYNYILLKEGTNAAAVEEKLPAFLDKYLGKIWEEHKFRSNMYLQPVADIHLKSDLSFEQDINSSERMVYFLSVLGLFVLIIAWINYVNLSTAKSLERSKEVGLRKVSGATKAQLVTQFFFDAFVVNLLAVILAAAILSAAIPYFDQLTGKDISGVLQSTGAWYSVKFWGIVLGAVTFGIIVVGAYPALVLSSFNPSLVLKGKFLKSQRGLWLRKGLVGFQYVLSVFLIAGTITIYQQLTYMQEQDLGYNKEQILIVRGPAITDSTYSNRFQHFRNELLQIPGLGRMTASSEIPGKAIADRNSIRKLTDDENESVVTTISEIDEEFIRTYEMTLAAGRNFDEKDQFLMRSENDNPITEDGYLVAGGQNRILINEALASRLGFANPKDAINQLVKIRIGSAYVAEVIGVVKNYHQRSLRQNFEPIAYFYPLFETRKYFSVRLSMRNISEAIPKVHDLFLKVFPENAFEYFFLDDYFNRQYRSDLQFGRIFGSFTVMAIVIACLGLFGLSVFSVTQRTKEVGIRKVLGASVSTILVLFSHDSVRLLLASYLISLPLVYLAAREWLSNFAFHIDIGWQIFLLPPLVLLTISIATIALISLRAAMTNPVVSLRHE